MKNYLLVILDAVRHDNFIKAVTPNMDSIGKVEKAYTGASWTLASIFGFLTVPSHIGFHDLLPYSAPEHFWVPIAFQENGYFTAYLHSNTWLTMHKEVFERGFDYFYDFDAEIGKPQTKYKLESMVDVCRELICQVPYFIVLHIMESHFPYFDGIKSYPKVPLSNQIKAIEYIDRQLVRLFKELKNTQVIITADHGTTVEGHCPKYVNDF